MNIRYPIYEGVYRILTVSCRPYPAFTTRGSFPANTRYGYAIPADKDY